MRFTQIYQILEIEKCSSISEAARKLYISQPGLSAVLNEFEREIGVQIFTRSKSGVFPTSDGVKLLNAMKKISDEADYILNYNRKQNELAGDINVVLGNSYEFLTAELIRDFKTNFPKANLSVEKYMPNVLDFINKELIDFSIVALYRSDGSFVTSPNVSAYPKLQAFRLKDCRTYAIMNETHRLAGRSALKLSEILSEQLIFSKLFDIDLFVRNIPFERVPVNDINKQVALEFLSENFGIYLDSVADSKPAMEKYRKSMPGCSLVPIENDVTDTAGCEFTWPTYFMYKKKDNNRLHLLCGEEITRLLHKYELM